MQIEFKDPPFRLAEANVQAEFYLWCRILGCNCVLEVNTPVGRLDAAILSNDSTRIVAVVECKSECRSAPIEETKQFQRYASIGVPVLHLSSRRDAEMVAREVLTHAANNEGISIVDVMAMPRFNRKRRKGSNPNLYKNKRLRLRS